MTGKCLMLMGLMLGVIITGQVMAEPNLTLPSDNFDFGYIPQNARVSYGFWLHSTGTDTLKILSVKPGCGCTQTPLGKNILPPGDSTMLEIIYSSGMSVGRTSKGANITTNMSAPNSRVTFTADIVYHPDSTYPVIIKPYKLDISQFGDKSRTEMNFTVENVSDRDLTLSIIAVPRELVEMKLPGVIKAGKSVQGTLKIKKGKEMTEFQKAFTFEVNDNTRSRFTVPITRQIRTSALTQKDK